MIWIAKPKIGHEESRMLTEIIRTGMLAQGDIVKQFEKKFSLNFKSKHSIACSSGTAALHMAYLSLGLGPGDEVITTPFTFIATINMIKACGATPVYVDIKNDFNINEDLIEAAITDKTKMIVPVHLFGKPCNMYQIMRIAKKHKLKVVEDCAQALGAEYNGKQVGTFGDIGIFSFYPTKLITTGEGGICITNNEKLADKMRKIRNHGMDGPSYDYECMGYNYKMTNLAAGIGLIQFNKLGHFIFTRQDIAKEYDYFLDGDIDVPTHDVNELHVYNNYSFCIKNRDNFILNMKENMVDCRVYYPKPFADLPNATRISKEIVSIPIRPNLTNEETTHIIFNIKEILKCNGKNSSNGE